MISALIILCAAIAAVVTGTIGGPRESNSGSDFDIFDPSTWIPRWLDSNPHGGDSPYDFNTWDTKESCRGLELRIINNLEEKWEPYFERAIADWESGEPDVLTLNVRRDSLHDPIYGKSSTHSSGCDPEQGVLKVCNGDYGDTDWVGVNHAVIQWKHIVSSVAKMNDFHLDKLGSDAKQWTMCHELG